MSVCIQTLGTDNTGYLFVPLVRICCVLTDSLFCLPDNLKLSQGQIQISISTYISRSMEIHGL